MKIRSFLVVLLFSFFLHYGASAQSVADRGKYEYYLFVSGVDSKSDVERFEGLINSRPEVGYFLGDRFPVRFFLLRSNYLITKDEFISWIKGEKYIVEYFGLGPETKEDAVNLFYKHNRKAQIKN
jgi:hypothetical protein